MPLDPQSETLEMRVERYRGLYELARDALGCETERLHQIDQKASNYLGLVTFLLGLLAVFSERLLDTYVPPTTAWAWVVTILSGLFLGTLAVAWFQCYRVLRVARYAQPPVPEEFVRAHHLLDVYLALARTFIQARVENHLIGDEKASRIAIAYRVIAFAAVEAVLLTLAMAALFWSGA